MVHGHIEFPNKDLDDFIILRSDGTPIYNLAVVSDDIAMGITVVMRGDDHISNTPKQILLYEALGAPLPIFAHLPMINGGDGKKLSKRHGATAVGDYSELGILPDAMCNFLALLGWSPGGDREVMTRQELIDLFSADGLLKKAAVFDVKKLEWMNGQHLIHTPIDALDAYLRPFLVRAGLTTAEELEARTAWWHQLLELLRVRARTVVELVEQCRPYFLDDFTYDADAAAKQWKDRAGHGGAPARGARPARRHPVGRSGDGGGAPRARRGTRHRRGEDLPADARRAHRRGGDAGDLRRPPGHRSGALAGPTRRRGQSPGEFVSDFRLTASAGAVHRRRPRGAVAHSRDPRHLAPPG